MKFRVTLKDPDGVEASVGDAVKRFMTIMEETIVEYGLDTDEVDSLEEQREVVLRKHIAEWLRYNEYVTLEIDTVAKTCVVVKP